MARSNSRFAFVDVTAVILVWLIVELASMTFDSFNGAVKFSLAFVDVTAVILVWLIVELASMTFDSFNGAVKFSLAFVDVTAVILVWLIVELASMTFDSFNGAVKFSLAFVDVTAAVILVWLFMVPVFASEKAAVLINTQSKESIPKPLMIFINFFIISLIDKVHFLYMYLKLVMIHCGARVSADEIRIGSSLSFTSGLVSGLLHHLPEVIASNASYLRQEATVVLLWDGNELEARRELKISF